MSVHEVRCTMPNMPCKGLSLDDDGKALSWGTIGSGANANVGSLVESTDNSELAGLCAAVQKGDGVGSVASNKCTLEYAGVLRYPVKDSVTLSTADLGKKALGGADGTAKPVADPAALDPATTGDPTDAELTAYNTVLINYFKKAKGRIVDFSNDTGDKWIDVAGYFG